MQEVGQVYSRFFGVRIYGHGSDTGYHLPKIRWVMTATTIASMNKPTKASMVFKRVCGSLDWKETNMKKLC